MRKASQSSKHRCRPWVGASSRIQVHLQKLNWLCLRLAAVAEIQAHLVNCAARDDDEVVTAGSGGIGAWISQDMTQLNPNTERLQSPALKGGPIPLLRQDTVSFFPIHLKDRHIPQCDGMAYARVLLFTQSWQNRHGCKQFEHRYVGASTVQPIFPHTCCNM